MSSSVRLLLLFVVVVVGCAAPAAQSVGQTAAGGTTAPATAPQQSNRTLIIATDTQVDGFGPMFFGGKSGPEELEEMVQRGLADIDDKGNYFPGVTTQLPSIDDGTWRVLPDGTADMTWKLKPNVLWHDGTPLTTDDVLFSYQVATASDVPYKQKSAVNVMSGIEAVDAQTFIVHWKRLYVPGDRMVGDDFFLLPRHLMEDSFVNDRQGFVNSTDWSSGFIGLGPYKITGWVPASSADVTAFDGYYGQAPHIKNVTFKIIPDIDTAVATILSNGVDVWLGSSLGIEHAVLLQDQWPSKGGGQVIHYPRLIFEARFAPGDPKVSDTRMRAALYSAIDRQGIVRDLYDGLVQVADNYVIPGAADYDAIEAQTVKYPYDPAHALELLSELGITRGSDAKLHDASGAVVVLPFSTTTGNQERETMQATIASMWTNLGFDVTLQNVPLTVSQEPSYQYSTTDLSGLGADWENNMFRMDSRNLKTPQNPRGANVYGENNPEVDRLLDLWGQTPNRDDQIEIEAEMVHQISIDLPILPINYRDETVTEAKGLSGLLGRTGATGTTNTWNIETWQFTQ